MDSSLINEVNLKIMNSSSGKTKELFIPIIFYDNKNMARNLPSKYGRVETLDKNGVMEIQIFNNSWFSKDYDKKVIAWRYINNNL